MNINKVILCGRTGKIGALKYFDDGSAVIEISLATEQSWKTETGRDSKTEWHNVQFKGKQAETISSYLEVGQELFVEGAARTRTFEKAGVTQYFHFVDATEFNFGQKPRAQPAEASLAAPRTASRPGPAANAPVAAAAPARPAARAPERYTAQRYQPRDEQEPEAHEPSQAAPSPRGEARPVRSTRVPRYAR